MAVLALAFLLLVAWKLYNDQRARAQASGEQNRQTQDAILKLLDEMATSRTATSAFNRRSPNRSRAPSPTQSTSP